MKLFFQKIFKTPYFFNILYYLCETFEQTSIVIVIKSEVIPSHCISK